MAAVPDEDTDENLLAALQEGDAQAFDILVRRHTDRFYAVAYRICAHKDRAEDIVQEAFLKLWRRPEAFDPTRGAIFTTWFTRVVMNLAIDQKRRSRPEYGAEYIECFEDERPSALQDLQDQEEAALVEAAIQDLPERQKMALNLCFYEGLSNKEAAEVLEVNIKALESLLMRAKSKLKDVLLKDKRKTGM